jgi:RNA polymerase sigma-70 factor (ECF subfamily)
MSSDHTETRRIRNKRLPGRPQAGEGDATMEQTLTPAIIIEQLYHDHHQPICRYLNRLVSDQETAEDLCHETFIKALRHWNELEHVALARSWLYRIATTTAYNYLRRRRPVASTPLTDEHEVALTLETHFDDAEPVWAALNHLPDQYRIPLLLQLWAGLQPERHRISAGLQCHHDQDPCSPRTLALAPALCHVRAKEWAFR